MTKFEDLKMGAEYETIWGVNGFRVEYAGLDGTGCWYTAGLSYPPVKQGRDETRGFDRYVAKGFAAGQRLN